MSNYKHKMLLWVLAVLGALGTAYGTVFAGPQANIGLSRFQAIPLDNAVRLEWDTETELETAGYMLKRGQTGSFDYLVNTGAGGPLFISSEGGPATGASYNFTDETAANGQTYVYQLVEVEVNGTEVVQAEAEVVVGLVPTDTPIVLAFNGGGGESSAASPTPTETPLATATVANPTVPPISVTEAAVALPAPALTQTPTSEPEVAAQPATAATTADAVQPQPTPAKAVRESNPDPAPGAAVALAQENPEGYPAQDPTAAPLPEVNDQGEAAQDATEPGVVPDQPDVIGATPYPANPALPTVDLSLSDDVPPSNPSATAGRVYLWLGFLAAIVIFSAAVLGAILLYTRRRSEE